MSLFRTFISDHATDTLYLNHFYLISFRFTMNHPDKVHRIYKAIDGPDYISTGACAESSSIVSGPAPPPRPRFSLKPRSQFTSSSDRVPGR
jgi:hypothetical protein